MERAVGRTARGVVRPEDVRVEVVKTYTEQQMRTARAEGFRAAARMVAVKSDLLRGTRGGGPRCTELDLMFGDLMEQAEKNET